MTEQLALEDAAEFPEADTYEDPFDQLETAFMGIKPSHPEVVRE